MSTTQTVFRGKDTAIAGQLYVSFELGDKSWNATASDGLIQPLLREPPMRISIQACIEGEGSSSPRLVTIGCVEREAGVGPVSGMGVR